MESRLTGKSSLTGTGQFAPHPDGRVDAPRLGQPALHSSDGRVDAPRQITPIEKALEAQERANAYLFEVVERLLQHLEPVLEPGAPVNSTNTQASRPEYSARMPEMMMSQAEQTERIAHQLQSAVDRLAL